MVSVVNECLLVYTYKLHISHTVEEIYSCSVSSVVNKVGRSLPAELWTNQQHLEVMQLCVIILHLFLLSWMPWAGGQMHCTRHPYQVRVPYVTPWGDWGNIDRCPKGSHASGFSIKVSVVFEGFIAAYSLCHRKINPSVLVL